MVHQMRCATSRAASPSCHHRSIALLVLLVVLLAGSWPRVATSVGASASASDGSPGPSSADADTAPLAERGLRAFGGATLAVARHEDRLLVAEGARLQEYRLPLTSDAVPIRGSALLPGIIEDLVVTSGRIVVTCHAAGVAVLSAAAGDELAVEQIYGDHGAASLAVLEDGRLLLARRGPELAVLGFDDADRLVLEDRISVQLEPGAGAGRSRVEHVAVRGDLVALHGDVHGAPSPSLALLRVEPGGAIVSAGQVELPQHLGQLEAIDSGFVGVMATQGIVLVGPLDDRAGFGVLATLGDDLFDTDVLAIDAHGDRIAALTLDRSGEGDEWVGRLIDAREASAPVVSAPLLLDLEPRAASNADGLPFFLDAETLVVSSAGLWSFGVDAAMRSLEPQARLARPGRVHDALVSKGGIGYAATDSGIWSFDPAEPAAHQRVSRALTRQLAEYEDGVAFVDAGALVHARRGPDGELREQVRYVDGEMRLASFAVDGSTLFASGSAPRGVQRRILALDLRGPDAELLGAMTSDLSVDAVDGGALASPAEGGISLVDVRDPRAMRPLAVLGRSESHATAGLEIHDRTLVRTARAAPGTSLPDRLELFGFDLAGSWSSISAAPLPEGALGALAVAEDRIYFGTHGADDWTTELGVARIGDGRHLAPDEGIDIPNVGSPIPSIQVRHDHVLVSARDGGLVILTMERLPRPIHLPLLSVLRPIDR